MRGRMKLLEVFIPRKIASFSRLAITLFAVVGFSNQAFAAQLTTLVDFNITNGESPQAGLIFDTSGNLYGTTAGGGTASCNGVGGTVFQLTSIGALNTLGNLCSISGIKSGVVSDSAGNLYGTTTSGGSYGYGTVFQLKPPAPGQTAWTQSTLVEFNLIDGGQPYASLVRDSAGNLYGTTRISGNSAGGWGTIFQLKPPAKRIKTWTFNTLVYFNYTNGATPMAGLIFDSAGNLYGTTASGGSANNAGTVFQLKPPSKKTKVWTLNTLAIFDNANGKNPDGSLIFDSIGNLYGTTSIGGQYGYGTVFQLTPPVSTSSQTPWTLNTLVDFDGTNGANSYGNLVRDSAGNLYGTTYGGGLYGYGTVFQLSPSTSFGWTLNTLVDFDSTNGANSEAGLIFDSAGNLYGTTSIGGLYGYGTVFRVTP
jgi:uncharacterized repeat protein (TIGR03803 family)